MSKILTRPQDSGECHLSYCSDELIHAFEGNASSPVCLKEEIQVRRDVLLHDNMYVCDSCYNALEAWGRGGSLKISLA